VERRYSWPDQHWNWPISVTHKHGLRCGDMIWVGRQVDLSPDGRVLNPNNLKKQTAQTMLNFAAVLHDLGCDFEDLVCLTCYYVNDSKLGEADFLHLVVAALPDGIRTCVVIVPVPSLAYEGLQVEIEGIAMRRPDGSRIARSYASCDQHATLPLQFCSAIRSGKMIFVSTLFCDGNSEFVPASIGECSNQELLRIKGLLKQFGADIEDVVKCNYWVAGDLNKADIQCAVQAAMSCFEKPGPVTTITTLPGFTGVNTAVRLSCVAMLGEDGARLTRRYASQNHSQMCTDHPWSRHGLKCENMIFLGGQISAGTLASEDMSEQTHQAMQQTQKILGELGADINDVCKVTTYYQADCGADKLHANLPIRSSYFHEPSPTTTGIPLPCLSSHEALIEIETIAMSNPDDTAHSSE